MDLDFSCAIRFLLVNYSFQWIEFVFLIQKKKGGGNKLFMQIEWNSKSLRNTVSVYAVRNSESIKYGHTDMFKAHSDWIHCEKRDWTSNWITYVFKCATEIECDVQKMCVKREDEWVENLHFWKGLQCRGLKLKLISAFVAIPLQTIRTHPTLLFTFEQIHFDSINYSKSVNEKKGCDSMFFCHMVSIAFHDGCDWSDYNRFKI